MTQSAITLYYHPFSNCAQRVLLYLEEKGIDHDKRVISLLKSEQLSDAFLAINPRGRVPAISYQGRHYNESCDIMRLLESEFPDNGFIPEAPDARQQMDSFVDSAKASHDMIKDVVYACGMGRLPTDKEMAIYQRQDPENADFHHRRRNGQVGCHLARAYERATAAFMPLEKALADSDWLAGDYSLADMAWFPNTIILRQCGFDFSVLPKVDAWIKRVEARPAYPGAIGHAVDKVPYWLMRCLMRGKRLFQPSRY